MLHIEHFTSVSDIPVAIWERFSPRSTVGLEINHLRAVEMSRINDIHPYYLIGYRDKEAVGITYCFSVRINLAKMANSYSPEVIETITMWKPDFMDLRIIEVGHIASLGSTIEVLPDCLPEFLHTLTGKIDEIACLEKADLCIIRDITTQRYSEFKSMESYGYRPAMGFPIARLPLKWKSFDDFLASLKSKKRNSIKQRRSKFHVPEISVEVIEDYAPYSERLAELWTNVARKNNGYEHERLTPAYFEAMSANLPGRSHIVAIKQKGNIIAYGLNLVGDEEFFGVAEGMDYAFNESYELYANNILESLRLACEMQKSSFNIGITSYDFKTSVGAELDPCIYLMKAYKDPCYSAVYADLIRKSILQPENKHRVFRYSDTSRRVQPKDAEDMINHRGNALDPFDKHLRYTRIDEARAADLYTFCPVFESAQEPVIKHNGRDIIMLGTNAYLGLSTHPKVMQAAHDAITKYGTGCSGSPMLNGTLNLHCQLSHELAHFMNKQAALIFSTGYQTNVGAISALVNRNDVLIMDERNHASLIDGAILSRARLVRFTHNDIGSLEAALIRYADKPKLVVTDSLFSMEGTMIDLPAIVSLVKKHNTRLMLDESHAIGVMGRGGRGVAEHFGLLDEVDIIMGTFSKSLASTGGFIAGDSKIIDTIKHTSRAHIFSASLAPSAVATVLAALQIIWEEPERRIRVLKNAGYLAEGLRNLGYTIDYHNNAVIPVFCGHELIAVAAFHKLFEEGIFVNPVTSPAVPRNQEILRVSVMATHDEKMLRRALDIFGQVRTPCWPVSKLVQYVENT